MASIGNRLYRGELGVQFIGLRRRWYIAAAVLLSVCLVSIIWRGFNFGIEFEGGNSFQFPGTEQQLDAAQAASESVGVEVASAQVVGQDSIILRTPELSNETAAEVAGAVADALGIDATAVSNSAVSARWGGDITNKALQALIVFLVAVTVFIALRFQPKMSVAALAALINDLIVAAGVYSLVGFEVTPSTVIGLLTILGFSLYDTVVVFDKVDENTRGILGGSRTTYSEAANLAVNQTLMRSINTSLIALLPVAGLLFVGAGLLGAGTLKDLALVLFVGLATGTYSSIFLASPILCDLKEREPAYMALAKRVEARRASGRGTDVEPARPSKAAPRRSRSGSGSGPGSGSGSKKPPAGKASAKAQSGKPSGVGKAAAVTAPAATGLAGQAPAGNAEAGNSEAAPSAALRPSARRAHPDGERVAVSLGKPAAGRGLEDADHTPDDALAVEVDGHAGDEAVADEAVAESAAPSPAVRPAPGQRSRSGRPTGKTTPRRGGRPSGKRKR
ncbi:MAG: protein translocase subunit SecF [Geodermatophilaceae bacterium]|nr:protein translocase subunit SecF [Geodermatophilaceae bacterium]